MDLSRFHEIAPMDIGKNFDATGAIGRFVVSKDALPKVRLAKN